MSEDSIRFECQHCGQHLDAPSDMAGESVECPACGKTTEVATPAVPVPAEGITCERPGDGLAAAAPSPQARSDPDTRGWPMMLLCALIALAVVAAIMILFPKRGREPSTAYERLTEAEEKYRNSPGYKARHEAEMQSKKALLDALRRNRRVVGDTRESDEEQALRKEIRRMESELK